MSILVRSTAVVIAAVAALASPAAAQSTFYGCVSPSRTGQLRLVNGPGQCNPTERPVQWQSGADLSQVLSAIEGLSGRVAAVEAAVNGLPAVQAQVDALSVLPDEVSLDVADLIPRGNALGCDLVRGSTTEGLFQAECNQSYDPGETAFGLALALSSPAQAQYVYDGLYLCGIHFSPAGLGGNIRLSVYFPEILRDESGNRVYQRRDSSLNATRRGLIFQIPTSQLQPLEVDASTAGLRPCVTLPFASGIQDGDQPRLPEDIWVPNGQLSIFMSLPPMLPTIYSANQYGDTIAISEIGLTVAGRRPAPEPAAAAGQ